MASQDSTRWWYAAEASLGLAVVSLPLALGGAPRWTAWLLCGCAASALLSWLMGAWKHRRRMTWHFLLALPIGVASIAAVSLLPLPPGLLALLSPPQAELRDFALVPLGLEGWRPLTADAPSTWRALGRCLSLGSMLFVALQLGRLEGPRRRLVGLVALTGALVAVVGFGHLLSGAESLFGVWHFYAGARLLTFFGNTNHLAGFLAFCATVAIALALEHRSREASIAWGAVAVTCGTGVFLSFSRGGVGTFVITGLLVVGVTLARRQGGLRGALPWLIMAGTVVYAVSLASDQLLERAGSLSSLEKLEKTKLELWPMFWTSVVAHWRAGMGLGAFELAFGRFQTSQLDVTFTHPENLVLQWAAELGLVLSVVLGLAVAAVAWSLVRRVKGVVSEQVLLLAVLGAGLHDLFDFALELNALPVAVMVVVGLVAGREPVGLPEPRRFSARRGGLAGAAVLSVLSLAACWRGLPGHERAEARLAGLVESGQPTASVRAAAIEAINRHPADWVLYAAVAQQLGREGAGREALAWVNRVLFLRPGDAGAHVAAGRALLQLKQPTQALLEFKTAWLLGDSSSFDEGLRLAARLAAFDRLLVDSAGLLTRCWERYVALGHLEHAQQLLEAVEQLPPSPEVFAEAQVLRVWQSNATQRWAEALERYEALPTDVRSRPDLLVLSAMLLSRTGRGDEAIQRLDAVARKEPQNLSIATTLVDLLASEKRTGEARDALNRTRPFVTGPYGRSQLFQKEATLWALEERWPRALEALQTAARIEPSRADLRYRMAQVYEQMGSLHSAIDEIRKGRLLDSAEGAKAQDAWVSRLELAMESQRVE